MKKIVLITGATSGIGKSCAEKFAAKGMNIIITGRRKSKLDELKINLEEKYKIEILSLCFDVQNKIEVFESLNGIPLQWKAIDILINNAGLALGKDSFEDASIEDWETMMNTNVHGLMYVSKAVIPMMIEQQKGHIINIGSVAGKEVYENGNAYCASKFAVDALSKGMRIDLLKYGIKVTAIHPGAVETEFSLIRFKGDAQKAIATYNGYSPLKPEDISETIYFVATLPDHTCINELTITCTQQANAVYFHKKTETSIY